MPIVVADHLSRQWPGSSGPPIVAAHDLSFSVEAGTVFGLLGSNGAGKSTTMRMLATLTQPSSGTATVCGHDVVRAPAAVRASLGYLSATSGLPARLSCREVLELFAALHRVADVRAAVEHALERFAITEFAGRRTEELSTGMRQRVRIACAAVHRPPVLILDEPTAGLDLVAADRLLDTILEARAQGTTVLFSTHILREVARVCDRVAIIDGGRLRAEGTVDDLLRTTGAASFDEAFLAVVRG
jgi:sodium transport system ATP-binding protein